MKRPEQFFSECSNCGATYPGGLYCLRCGHVPPRSVETEVRSEQSLSNGSALQTVKSLHPDRDNEGAHL